MNYLAATLFIGIVSVTVAFDEECVGKRNGATFSDEYSCSRYRICLGGYISRGECEAGLYWDNFRRLCLPAALVQCSAKMPPIVPTTTYAPPTTDDTILDVNDQSRPDFLAEEYSCPAQGVLSIPHRRSCSQYVLCFDGTAVLQRCAPGLHFNAAQSVCTLPDLAYCDLQEQVCPEKDDPFKLVFVADRFDCSKYYYCYNGKFHPHSCAPGLHWDPVNNWCTTIAESKCMNFTPYTEVNEPTLVPKKVSCKDDQARWVKHPKSERHYYLCYKGKSMLKRCDDSLVWDEATHSCNFQH
ncbi:probable chitinase 10 [Anopheles ziemanni]|uniref:probable chitinase 10 n=1 Tax=Anopheles coustani TaxID=139045 RepID=UPI00265A4CE5|nr:probable chitinase 10 [Anopheles coustani]XP_058172511.1 probable chitinase 10 [Anopheles ziemanni]